MIQHRIDGLPLLRLKDYFTGCFWIGSSQHRDGVNAPGNDEIDRKGIEEAMVSR
jgi:hypothetical protein